MNNEKAAEIIKKKIEKNKNVKRVTVFNDNTSDVKNSRLYIHLATNDLIGYLLIDNDFNYIDIFKNIIEIKRTIKDSMKGK